MKPYFLAFPFALLSFHSFAADDKLAASDLELGVLSTSGNKSSAAVKANVKYNQEFDQWRNQYVLSGLYKKDEVAFIQNGQPTTKKQVSAEQYFTSAQTAYKLDDQHKAIFLFGSYDDTRFSGYDYQAAIALGFTDRLFETTNSFLDYSVGPGMAFTRTEELFANNGTMLVDNTSNETAILRAAVNYQYSFSETAKFTQIISSDIALESDSNTRTKSESAVIANLNQALAMKASVTVANNSKAPLGLKATDTQTALTLVYTF
jgi:putative salt-induced outer membrane protein YdiY